jgi:CHASE3 domain sensor protein
MKTLSAQLEDLSTRTRKLEELLGTVTEKNRTQLTERQAALRKAVSDGSDRFEERVLDLGGRARKPWQTLASSVDQRFSDLEQEAEKRRAKHGAKKAGRTAERAEKEAAAAVGLVLLVLDQAEAAAVDAALARADADDAAATAG